MASLDVPARLDAWLPRPAVRTRHSRAARATPEALWRAAREVRLADTARLERLVRWRIPGLPRELTYDGLFRDEPFTVLEEGEHASLSGLCGRIWTLKRDYPRLGSPEAFVDWAEPGTVRVLFAHWVEAGADERAVLHSEARVLPVGVGAAVRLRAVWGVLGRFERLVGAEPLAVAVRRAEAAPAD